MRNRLFILPLTIGLFFLPSCGEYVSEVHSSSVSSDSLNSLPSISEPELGPASGSGTHISIGGISSEAQSSSGGCGFKKEVDEIRYEIDDSIGEAEVKYVAK